METEAFSLLKLVELGPAYAVIAVLIYLLIHSIKQYENLVEVMTKLAAAMCLNGLTCTNVYQIVTRINERLLKGDD